MELGNVAFSITAESHPSGYRCGEKFGMAVVLPSLLLQGPD